MDLLRKNRLILLIFIGPSFIIYTYFMIYSIFSSFYYSLTSWDAISNPIFVGLKNYASLLGNKDFEIVMQNTLIGLVLSLVTQIPLGLIFAFLIYRTLRGFRIYRAFIFLPVVLAPAAIAMLFTLIFNSDIGPINKTLEILGLGIFKHNWLSDSKVVFYTVLAPMIYQYIGFYVIIMLAGMQSISEEIIESASIDGANSFRIFLNIVVPMLWNIIIMCVIMVTTGLFKSFEHSYIMTWGGPGVRSAFLGVYMYMTAFLRADFGTGCAIAMVILVGAILFAGVFKAATKKFDY